MNRTIIINDLIRMHNYSSYLEIGVFAKLRNYSKIRCRNKTGIDPALSSDNDGIIRTTSDIFFEESKAMFDLIFVDGDHGFHQCAKDVNNALMALNPGGCIVMHDCLPESPEEAAKVYPGGGGAWCGGVYAVYMLAFNQLAPKERFIIDVDHGIGIIKPQSPAYLLLEHYAPWAEYEEARSTGSLNIKSRWTYEDGCNLLLR